jgi:hypothetical protein
LHHRSNVQRVEGLAALVEVAGFRQTDADSRKPNNASTLPIAITFPVLYGAIALFACYGHAIAADAWMDAQRGLGAFFFLVVACAVAMTVFNDLGAIAARNDAAHGARLGCRRRRSRRVCTAHLETVGRQVYLGDTGRR